MESLFHTKHHLDSLPLSEERGLIADAQLGYKDAAWKLLVQYSGLLQSVSFQVRARVTKMTAEQIEDLEGDLVLAALEAIHEFDPVRYVRLSQVLPSKLKEVAKDMETALTIPSGTLSLWFKIWRQAGKDFEAGTALAPQRGMSAETFMAIRQALTHSDSQWVTMPYDAGQPTADQETHQLVHLALDMLSPQELEVIEYAYGFRGDPKSDGEIADIIIAPRVTVSKRRSRSLDKMRAGLTSV